MSALSPLPRDVPIDQVSLLVGIPLEKREAVLRCLEARISRFDKGDVLASRTHKLSCTRFLIAGKALMVRFDAAGNRSILGSYHEGSVIASELTPRFCTSSNVDILAYGPCSTLDFCIPQKVEGRACCIKHINLIKGNLVASLTNTNMRLVRRLDTLANRSTREKVLAYLQERSDEAESNSFSIPYNRQELADYLYIERSALSRELGRMQQEGIISFHRNCFTLTRCDSGTGGMAS